MGIDEGCGSGPLAFDQTSIGCRYNIPERIASSTVHLLINSRFGETHLLEKRPKRLSDTTRATKTIARAAGIRMSRIQVPVLELCIYIGVFVAFSCTCDPDLGRASMTSWDIESKPNSVGLARKLLFSQDHVLQS